MLQLLQVRGKVERFADPAKENLRKEIGPRGYLSANAAEHLYRPYRDTFL